mmetsp:Transcript_31992/g.44608  ORF Transcript_31992/g.44608 Transcript_31992/m.44608 type:complete len:659 (+) Transcript_31992:118-2094(+)
MPDGQGIMLAQTEGSTSVVGEPDIELALMKKGTDSKSETAHTDAKTNRDFREELISRHRHISSTLTDLVGDGGLTGRRIKLNFSNVELDIEGRRILNAVSGEANPGQVLSIMGPSGSGKTTLLNSLAGRSKLAGGTIYLNGKTQIRAMRRYIAYVLQDEVFFGTMTVKQILYFAARIRLPESMSENQKLNRADKIMKLLGIEKCADSIVGTMFQRGISGGERKRLNIAVQLITWPSLILLDEPTSGLDSSTSYDLVLTLKELAKRGCTVVMTIHQPSSAVFQLFDQLLVLSEGNTLYNGKAAQVVSYFDKRGFKCPPTYNPGDFVLELAKSKTATNTLLRDSPSTGSSLKMNELKEKGSNLRGTTEENWNDSFPTSWWTQFTALFHRAWIVKQSGTFDTLQLTQVFLVAVVASLVWFRSPLKESAIEDRFGEVFFIAIFWAFFPMFTSVTTFPSERAVLLRERAQGSYRLSAYYIAKVTAEMPLNWISPSMFIVMTYWMTGLNDDPAVFFAFWFLLILNVELTSGLGMLVSAAQPNPKKALVIVSVLVLASMLLGGFYVNPDNLPSWLQWAQWLSFVRYSFGALATQIFNRDLEFQCSDQSEFSQCTNGDTINGVDVLNQRGIPFYPVLYSLVTFGVALVSKIATYFVLFYRYKPKTP